MELTYINVGSIALALALALVNNRVIQYFAAPLFERFAWDTSLLLYVSAITGFCLALLANVDLFMPGLFAPTISRVISGIIIAGGSNLIHDIMPPTYHNNLFRVIKNKGTPLSPDERIQF